MTMTTRALIFSYSDCSHYFAGLTEEPEGLSNNAAMLKNSLGKPQKFPSLYRAKLALKELGHEKAWLVMHSAYDEMIGNEPAQQCEMLICLGDDD